MATLMLKFCRNCNGEFSGFLKEENFCSEDCHISFHENIETQPLRAKGKCLYCKELFLRISPSQKFCNNICWVDEQERRRKRSLLFKQKINKELAQEFADANAEALADAVVEGVAEEEARGEALAELGKIGKFLEKEKFNENKISINKTTTQEEKEMNSEEQNFEPMIDVYQKAYFGEEGNTFMNLISKLEEVIKVFTPEEQMIVRNMVFEKLKKLQNATRHISKDIELDVNKEEEEEKVIFQETTPFANNFSS